MHTINNNIYTVYIFMHEYFFNNHESWLNRFMVCVTLRGSLLCKSTPKESSKIPSHFVEHCTRNCRCSEHSTTGSVHPTACLPLRGHTVLSYLQGYTSLLSQIRTHRTEELLVPLSALFLHRHCQWTKHS